MSIMRPIIMAAAGIAVLVAGFRIAQATDNRALDADVLSLSEEWAKAKYLSRDAAESEAKMAHLAVKADDLVIKYPGRAEALIWSGIIASERASQTWGVSA